MLVAKRHSDAARVIAANEARNGGPWSCPQCNDGEAIKKGQIKIHHFAHMPPVRCQYGTGESEAHRRCKTAVWQGLCRSPGVTKCELERDLGSVRPDVSAYINGEPVAIEVQISALTLDQIQHRTTEYAAKRISVLWIGQWDKALEGKKYAPAIWEKWLHACYFGRVYYWCEGLTVQAVHFGEHLLFVDFTEWHSQGGSLETGGGYHRASKRWRTPKPAPRPVSILDMHGAVRQEPWAGGKLVVPPCRIQLDRAAKWW